MSKKYSSTEYTPAFLKLAEKLHFPEKKLPLLQQAVTHPAFYEGNPHPKEGDNQRLEFLGDAVLDLLIGEYLYHAHAAAHEGELSKMRAFIVRESSLAEAALDLQLDQTLRLGRGSEAGGDRQRASVLADAYEAVVGAVFVGVGLSAAREMLLAQFQQRMDLLTPSDYEDKKSLLQELVQSKVPHGVTYRLLSTSGPDHCPEFESAVFCGKLMLGSGHGGSKKESELAAAADALTKQQGWLTQIR